MITGLSHVCLPATDIDRSVAFYRDRLGLEAAFEFSLRDGEVRGVYLHAGGRTFIEFFERPTTAGSPKARTGHICLEVDAIQKTVADLRSGGVNVSDVTMGVDNTLGAWLADPDGNRIELHQFQDNSLQTEALRRFLD